MSELKLLLESVLLVGARRQTEWTVQLQCGGPGGGGLLVSRVAPPRVDSQTRVDGNTAAELDLRR